MDHKNLFMHWGKVFFILLTFGLGSCVNPNSGETALPLEIKTEIEQLNQAVLDQNAKFIKSKAHNSVKSFFTETNILNTLVFLPFGNPEKVDLAGVEKVKNYFLQPGKKNNIQYRVSYHLKYPLSWALISYHLIDDGDGLKILGLDIKASPFPFQNINAFTLKGKNILHYSFIFLAFMNLIFLIITFFFVIKNFDKCFRDKHYLVGFFWLVFIFFQVGSFDLNWTTGQVFPNFFKISFLIFYLSFFSPFHPWFFQINFPFGALMFWVFKNRKILK